MTPSDHDLPADDGPLDDDTLAVNAVVDDDATAEQRRRVARDPQLVARVASLRSAVDAVATPVDSPSPDVLAAVRRRALEALHEPETAVDEPDPSSEEEYGAAPVVPPAPVRDLTAARARRRRTLPALPAVAAVVIVLVVVGLGLIFAGSGSSKEDTASSGDAATAEDSGDGGGSGGEQADQDSAGAESADAGDTSPAAAATDDLLARTTATYADDDALFADLRTTDPISVPLTGEGTSTPPSTTTVPSQSEDGASTTIREQPFDAEAAQRSSELAQDPAAVRCDTVLRSAERDLEPATAAALVEVDGQPVLVLSSPIPVSDDAPTGIRLTALNALDCTPRGAVVR